MRSVRFSEVRKYKKMAKPQQISNDVMDEAIIEITG
jgi:hypothetical protein